MLASGHQSPIPILCVRIPHKVLRRTRVQTEPFLEKTDPTPSDPYPWPLGPVSAWEVATDCSHLPRMLFIYFYVVKNESIGLETFWLLPTACY